MKDGPIKEIEEIYNDSLNFLKEMSNFYSNLAIYYYFSIYFFKSFLLSIIIY